MISITPRSTLFPYTTLFRSVGLLGKTILMSKLSPQLIFSNWEQLLAFKEVSLLLPQFNSFKLTKLERSKSPSNLLSIRSEEHTSELQSRQYLVCRLLLEKKN